MANVLLKKCFIRSCPTANHDTIHIKRPSDDNVTLRGEVGCRIGGSGDRERSVHCELLLARLEFGHLACQ
jgi:hypothetical protein